MKGFSCLAVRSIRIGLLLVAGLNGCAVREQPYARSRKHTFIVYWPRHKGSDRLRLGVKDNIDVEGVVTSAGSEYLAKNSAPAARDAKCLAIARKRNVEIVGKTNLSEFALAPSGINDYFGTPRNPIDKRHKLIPGGSSSGSATAVASGLADVAFATDTAGSIRVPAACCGVVGLKTTFGLVSVKGVFPIEPKHLDTVGPMGKDVDHVVTGMDLLKDGFKERYRAAVAAKPVARKIRVGRLYLSGTDPKIDRAIDKALASTGFKVVRLDKDFESKWDLAERDGNTVAAAGAWISDQQYLYKTGVSARTKTVISLGRLDYPTGYRNALRRRPAWQSTLRRLFKKVDFIALPTLQTLPPSIPPIGKIALLEALVLDLQNTVAVNLAGNPALAVPIPVDDKTAPLTSLQLVGPRLHEAELLNAGRLVEASVHSVKSRNGPRKTVAER